MPHSAVIEMELRDLPPEDGWRVVEKTGQASVTCPCGLDTGLIAAPDALSTLQEHAGHGEGRTTLAMA
ncbi:hypothetical protein PV755_00195 [Streptomyces caniscabiei]|uniref:hypothetical protein n=1 Tax=Streptomyces caniscabiei TaxID=2746961 RepID=UPI0029AB962F|nr:hypothetical protein [Streptomyces caniscabiei]MDX3507354.1 hypothetical protein [Streptomyces caniscabiei]